MEFRDGKAAFTPSEAQWVFRTLNTNNGLRRKIEQERRNVFERLLGMSFEGVPLVPGDAADVEQSLKLHHAGQEMARRKAELPHGNDGSESHCIEVVIDEIEFADLYVCALGSRAVATEEIEGLEAKDTLNKDESITLADKRAELDAAWAVVKAIESHQV